MSYIDKELLIERLKTEDKYKELLDGLLNGEFDSKDYKQMAKAFKGERLNDFYCNGFFGRRYDLDETEITKIYEEFDNSIVIEVKKTTAAVNEDDDEEGGYLYAWFSQGWNDWKTVYEHLNRWVNGE